MSEAPGDYWTGTAAGAGAAPEYRLRIEVVEGIVPLDRQLGVDLPKTVPDALLAPLFGQPAPDAMLQTYMILDAAQVPGLPELLESSGLEHRCLFKGKAFDDLKDAAPWVLRLEAGDRFTRNLFTRSEAEWHLWDAAPGIYLRSSGTLDEMWRHFRKFTRIQDERGKWYYWRFWEGGFLQSTLAATEPAERRRFFLDGRIASVHVLAAGRYPRLTTMMPPQ